MLQNLLCFHYGLNQPSWKIHGIVWINFNCFTIDESNQVKISREIMRCQGCFLKIALGTRVHKNRLLSFTDKWHIFYINDTQRCRWEIFADEGHLFYINSMQINRWQNFRDKGHRFYFNGMKISGSRNFTNKGVLLYIQPLCYAKKQLAKHYR